MKTLFLSLTMIFFSIELNAQHWSQQNTKMTGTYTAVNQVSVVDSNIVWVNGWNGSNQGGFIKAMARTKDQGITWIPGSYAGFGTYVRPTVLCGVSYSKAFCVAYDTAAGVGSFWKTTNGGTSWTTVPGVLNNGTTSFADGVKFWDHGKGFCYGDPVNNYFEIYTTSDSGSTWNAVNIANIPVSLSGEYGYNTSTCVSIVAGGIGFFITNKGRVFKTIDYGATWALTPNPPYRTVSNGKIIASSANYILFGNYPTSASTVESWKYTANGGSTWDTLTPTGNFYRYQLCYVPGTPNTFVATSPFATSGISYSYDGGKTWTDFADTAYLQPGGTNIQCLGVGFYNSEIGWVGNYTQPFSFNSILKYSSLSASASGSPATVCSGGSSQLDVLADGGNLYSYSWTSSPAGFTSNLKNPIVSPTVTTTYTVTVKSGPNTATSSVIVAIIQPYLPTSIIISSNQTGAICTGTSVMFTANPTNGGTAPIYQWKVNGFNAGTNSSTFTSSALANGDIVTCVLTSSLSCATGNPATSNPIPMTVSSSLPVSVSISANPSGEICSGKSVLFTASVTNGGSLPNYQWKVNNSNVGTNSSTFTSSTLANGDIVTCVLTSSLSCAAGNPATSNAIAVSVATLCPWEQTNGPYNGTITSLAISGNNIFAGTYGGVYLSANNGSNWTAVNTGLSNDTVLSLAISGSNILAGTHDGVFLSLNNGSSWTALSNGLPANTIVTSLAISGGNIFAGSSNGVYLSSNNGSSWTKVYNGWVTALAISGKNIFAGFRFGTGLGLILSTNNGSSWTRRDTGIPWPSITALAASGDTVYAGNASDGAYWSTNNGDSWSRFTAGSNPSVNAFAIDGKNVYTGFNNGYCWDIIGGIFLTSDHGSSWSTVYTGKNGIDVTAIAISGNNIFAGTDGAGLIFSTNKGNTWNAVNPGFPYIGVLALTTSGSNIFAGTTHGVFFTSDNGNIWARAGLPNDTIDAIAIKGNYIFAGAGGKCCNQIGSWWGYGNDINMSANYGCNWAKTSHMFLNVLSLAISGSNIFAVAAGGVYFSKKNFGDTLWVVNFGLPSNTNIYTLAISGSNIFLGTGNGAYLSTNNGDSWDAVNTGIPANTDIYTLAISGSNIFAGTSNNVYLSENNGNSWALINNGLPATTKINALAISGSNIFAGTNGSGVFLSSINGGSWAAVNKGLTDTIVNALVIIGDTLFAGTGSGVWERPLSEIITGIKEISNNESNISVYPNPAMDNLTIEATPPAIIEILNIKGQLIKFFATSGTKTSVDISAFPRGVYIVKVKTGKGVVARKFVKQ